MNKFGVIAFCGSKGSGKSTSATILKEVIGVPTEELALAGHLKEVCAKVFNVAYDSFIDPTRKEVELENLIVLDRKNLASLMEAFFVTDYNFDTLIRPHLGRVIKTPRSLLQYIGTDVLHPLDPLIHAKMVLKKKDPTKLTIVTDLRFVSEFEYFNTNHSNTFVPVYVRNSTAETIASADPHPSERQLHDFKSRCIELNNESTLTALKSGITKLVKEVYEQV